MLFEWLGETYGSATGNGLIESGVFPPPHLPPARLATWIAERTAQPIVRIIRSAPELIERARTLLRSAGVEWYEAPNDHLIYQTGSQWDSVPRSIAHWTLPDWSLTFVAQDIHALQLPHANLSTFGELLQSITPLPPFDLVSIHTESLDRDIVQGICSPNHYHRLPADLRNQFRWTTTAPNEPSA